jgi:hypothetical protein
MYSFACLHIVALANACSCVQLNTQLPVMYNRNCMLRKWHCPCIFQPPNMTPPPFRSTPQVRARQVEQAAQDKAAEEASAEERAYKAMEDMLGKAAARAWKEAKSAAARANTTQAVAAAATAAAAAAAAAGSAEAGGSGTGQEAGAGGEAGAGQQEGGVQEAAGDASRRSSGPGATEAAPATIANTNTSSSSNVFLTAVEQVMERQRAAKLGASIASTTSQLSLAVSNAAPAASNAPAAQPVPEGPAAPRKDQGNKALLAELGAKDPANVSWALLEEMSNRSDLGRVLADVYAAACRKGLPQRLSKRASLRITKEVNRR